MSKNYYLEELKERFETPGQAYCAYQLEKHMCMHAEASPFATPETQEAIGFAKKARTFFDNFAKGTVKSDDFNKEVFGLDKKTKLKDLVCSKKFINQTQTIGWGTETTVKLLSGTFFFPFDVDTPKMSSWDTLNDIMVAERNTAPTPVMATEKLTELAGRFGFQGAAISVRKAHPEVLQKLFEGFSQLADIVGCHKEQVGMKKCVLGISNVQTDYQGFFDESHDPNGANFMFVNEDSISTALAHEWLHMLDRESAKLHKKDGFFSETNGKIINFLDADVKVNEETRTEIRKEVSLGMFGRWVKGYASYIVDEKSRKYFEEAAMSGWKAIQENRFDLKSFEKAISGLTIRSDDDTNTFRKQFAATHMDAFNFAMNSPNYDETMFMTFAKNMDAKKVPILEENYCTSNPERFARLFERFYVEKAHEKGQESLLACPGDSFFDQSHAEYALVKHLWGGVAELLRDSLNQISPAPVAEKANVVGEQAVSGLGSVKERLLYLRDTFEKRATFEEQAVPAKLRR